MDHTHIVQASDLDRYAPTRESQAIIPELIYLLVKQSCSELIECRIPYGDSVNQPGWDGIVETEDGFLEFVPKGKSYWEIGTGADPQSKATEDFKKRTDEVDAKLRADSSFVFVTPRSLGSGGWNEPEQTKWLERRENSGWKRIRIIDGVKLADWLRECPAIGKWMAKKLNITTNLGGLFTATEHWDIIVSECDVNDPPIPPNLFTVGRTSACEALQKLFEGKTQTLMLFAESPQDVMDFVAAFLAGLDAASSMSFSNRCLCIKDEQAWRSIVESRSPHILVADTRLGLETDEGAALQTIARRKGHAVIVPLCGAWSGNSPEILKLRSPSQSQIEAVLRESGYSDTRANELGKIGGDCISALRRYLRGYGTVPPYATWDNATLIAQAGLVGKWDGTNVADHSALEILLGKKYGEWLEILRPDTLRSDSPLIQNNEKWHLVARGEAWNSLGSRITDEDLDRFQKMAVSVLSERDPMFDLSKEDRYAASIHGKVLSHSQLLRKGIAETLALIGSLPQSLTSCSVGKADATVVIIIRNLLDKASWERWASLDSIMPFLAEAAPGEFLDAVESALVDLSETPFHKLFNEEGSGGLRGSCYISGLLWALETLAWSPDYLSRVAVILADLASIDPGGSWANRPSNSLAEIFLPWFVQTTAPFERRKSAIEAVIKEQPIVGWRLVRALLPNSHSFSSSCRRPLWRDFIPRDWKNEIPISEYWKQISVYTDLAVSIAKSEIRKVCELIKILPDLPMPAHESLLSYLNSEVVVSLPEAERQPLWEELDKLVRRHRLHSNAKWALPEDAVNKIAEAAQTIAPTLPIHKYHHLFAGRDFDLYTKKGNYSEQQIHIDEARQTAILEILDAGSVDTVLKFACEVTSPYDVGRALGVIASSEIEALILPILLDSEDKSITQLVVGFIRDRFLKYKFKWVDTTLAKDWSQEHRAKFLTHLPFIEEIWIRVASHLAEAHEALYWKNAIVNPYGIEKNLTIAIEKLLKYERGGAAVMCAAHMAIYDKSRFNETLATQALLSVVKSENGFKELNNNDTVELITHLQDSKTSDKDALFQIEWTFLPWLDRFSSGAPITLEKRLASDPSFFAKVIAIIFRSKNSNEEECNEPDEMKKRLASNAYKLLTTWKYCPGTQEDGSFSAEKFNIWLNDARKLTEESGHTEVALSQIGHILTCAPPDQDGLWIHNAVAEALNFRDTGDMRAGFINQLFNDRGVHWFTRGEEESKIANANREKADALDIKGYTRFATAMRDFAEYYKRQAQSEAKRSLLE